MPELVEVVRTETLAVTVEVLTDAKKIPPADTKVGATPVSLGFVVVSTGLLEPVDKIGISETKIKPFGGSYIIPSVMYISVAGSSVDCDTAVAIVSIGAVTAGELQTDRLRLGTANIASACKMVSHMVAFMFAMKQMQEMLGKGSLMKLKGCNFWINAPKSLPVCTKIYI